MNVSAEEICSIINHDQQRGREVVSEVALERRLPMMSIRLDITNKPEQLARQKEAYNAARSLGLEQMLTTPFYQRVKTTQQRQHGDQAMDVLLTESSDVGTLMGEGWMIASWTSPLAGCLPHVLPGESCGLEVPGRSPVRYRVHETARYQRLLPEAEEIELRLHDGRKVNLLGVEDLADEDQVRRDLSVMPQQQYQARGELKLSQIISLTDEPQLAAMHLPFNRSLILEGPPGSGKTSIGLMRMKVLMDQQWEVLGLEAGKDEPFHNFNSMRCLVRTSEMQRYIAELMQSIGIQRVRVDRIDSWLLSVIREAGLLTGTSRQDPAYLSLLKRQPGLIPLYLRGFTSHAKLVWKEIAKPFAAALRGIDPRFQHLARSIQGWVKRLQRAVPTQRGDGRWNLAETLAIEATRLGWRNDLSGPVREQWEQVRREVERALALLFDRRGAVEQMFRSPAFTRWLALAEAAGLSRKVVDMAVKQWRDQYDGERPASSEADLTVLLHLAGLTLLTGGREPWIGARQERLTHLVIDEVQDLDPAEVRVLASMLVPEGTLTLMGDLRQNLSDSAGLRDWKQLSDLGCQRAVVKVNHRQTRPLGGFVQQLHRSLFHQKCMWKASQRLTGPRPRVYTGKAWDDLLRITAQEAAQWRDVLRPSADAGQQPQPLIAILSVSELPAEHLLSLTQMLRNLSLAVAGKAGLEGTSRADLDGILIKPASEVKGLEFDAVIVVDASGGWSDAPSSPDLWRRNSLFVACSRGRAGLSLCMAHPPQSLLDARARRLYETV